MKIFYSIASIPERSKNLERIIRSIDRQSDFIFVNLVGYEYVPEFLDSEKIKVNIFSDVGSEIRFFDYYSVPNDSYYFTIDDDILYPEDYTERMVAKMSEYGNSKLCCVHGSDMDLGMKSRFYRKNRTVFHFSEEMSEDRRVMVPGVGTSCFYRGKMDISISRYETKNMSDVYTACYLAEQQIPAISVSRLAGWLVPMNEFGRSIYGSNPYREIDSLVLKYKDMLVF